jgi:hypothetical protein
MFVEAWCPGPVGISRGAKMETRVAQQAKASPVNPGLMSGAERHGLENPLQGIPAASEHKAGGYGLPCSRCRAYYPADLKSCPICKCSERVSPAAVAALPVAPAAPQPEQGTPLEDERERFLKQLKSQVFASHTQINAAATFRCVLDHNHNGDFEPAAVCHTCYGALRQQADRLEAALHMDVKEAAQIVYNAVWSDASDPGKTYQNAAAALLTELRNRAGIGLLLGSHQPLAH